MKQLLLTSLFFLCILSSTFSSNYFEYSPTARSAYEKATSLRFREARVLIQKLKEEEPNNLIVHHIENYIDFFLLYILEDEKTFDKLKKQKNERLHHIQKGDKSSPYYLFIQADIRLQWALARLKFDEFFGAFRDVSKAYKLLKDNQKRFPDFMPNYKDIGILHAMVGTIPSSYKWGVELLSGMRGSISQGRGEIEKVIAYSKSNPDFIFRAETEILYAYLLLHLENDEQKSWSVLESSSLTPEKNPLHCFVKANVAMRIGKNTDAIELLELRPKGRSFQSFPYLDFMLGTAKLRRLDVDADRPLISFIQSFQGINFIKEAYQKLAWHELVHNRPVGYRKYMKDCVSNGYEIAGGDKNALKEAKSGIIPDKSLIKARLLFDGGYYQKAYNVLLPQTVKAYNAPSSQIEYTYRMGRILHGLKDYNDALNFYTKSIQMGKNQPYYFACNAALQSGIIYELLLQKEKAIEAYKLCLDINPEEYKTGLHHKAKSGLARLKD